MGAPASTSSATRSAFSVTPSTRTAAATSPHLELRLGDDVTMPTVPREAGDGGVRIPLGSEHQLDVVVEDADAHHDRASAAGAAGAEIVTALHDTDHGSRDYAANDPEGNTWSFGTYRPSARKPGGEPAPRPDMAMDRARRARFNNRRTHSPKQLTGPRVGFDDLGLGRETSCPERQRKRPKSNGPTRAGRSVDWL
jgi:uncharacterized glyoxalase superfamily protein PhnB